MSLREPLIDRKEDVYSILRTYFHQFSSVDGKLNNLRPAACFSPQVFGAGKSFVGENFLEFLKKFADEEEEQTKTEVFNKSSSGKVDLKIFSWKHFAENTLSVCFKLEEGFSRAPFPRFLEALMYNIILNAYRQNGKDTDALQMAQRMVKKFDTVGAIDYLLEQFEKQYLFLMIDELSHLSYLTKYYSELTKKQFIESDPKYVPFRNFFRILRNLLITGKLLPSDDLQHRFVELLKKKTGGIPLIVRNTLLALVEKVANLSQPVINDENMEPLLDRIFQEILKESGTFIIPEILDSATLLRYQFVLLNYQLGTIFPIKFAITLCGTKTYLMDLVATFGFYSESCGTDGIDTGTKFKIGCCEFILRAHSNYNFFREATELFPLSPFSYIPDTSTAKGVFFEFVFMKIFRFRLLTFLHSNSSPIVHSAIPGIFQGSFIEQDNVSYSMESTKSCDIPILRNVSDSFSDDYRKHLQHGGIFVPKDGNSSGPDAYVVFHNGQTRYVVGFSFKFYHKTEFSKANIKKEAKKFFKEVISVLNNESPSSVQLCFQFVVVLCTKYDRSVGFSVEEQNIVEDASDLVTQHSTTGSTLNESSRSCMQLIIVSQRNLERYLGIDNVDILRKIEKANREEFSKDFSVWCKTLFESMSNKYVSYLEAEQSNVTSRVAQNIRPRINEENRMQMEGFQSSIQLEKDKTRREQVSSDINTHFDWKEFLCKSALLPEEVATRYAFTFPSIFGDNPQVIRRKSLELMGIPEQYIQKILRAAVLLKENTEMKE
ncbi:archaeal ATPase [Galdieria sulphuraria]|uniref:Archaeal ATPase n=1 Tax=Galdieria sulphuraria TaxID=130081 RepID=M2XZ11_GALSU|nr:archaeal ATPase [Galdieria sulphuraria]EME28873.1 archaeal ATPase [Galdieria sulphuraria]|eukprot:XP_005705393.1 archaeal ATPase [Galdieria sulphuraria]